MNQLLIYIDANGLFWHRHNNIVETDYNISDFEVSIDGNIFNIIQNDGAIRFPYEVQNISIQTFGGAIETGFDSFTLVNRLIELNYTPYLINTPASPPVVIWRKGDSISRNVTQEYIDVNFDATGLGINEMVGWAKRNGQNGTRDVRDRVLINQGTKFPNVGYTYGFENTVLVAHEHDSAVYSNGKKGVNTVGAGAAINGYILASGGTALDNTVKTSKVGKDQNGTSSTTETGVDKNYQPSLVELFIERVTDLVWVGNMTAIDLADFISSDSGNIIELGTDDKLFAVSGGGGSQTPSNLFNQYNGTSVTVPSGFTLTRIVSLNDINTAFTGIVTGTDLVITDGVSGDIYLIDGYTI